MRKPQRQLVTLPLLLVGALLASSCQISLSRAPQGTPTLIPTGFFTTPNSGGLSIQTIAAFGTQTAAARTAGPGTGTPATLVASPTPLIVTMTPTSGTPGTPTNALVTIPALATTTPLGMTNTPGGPTPTTLPPGTVPTTYTLQNGEFPYCLARRFNVNPQELLTLNGIAPEDVLLPGTTLKIPQGGSPFPGTRALRTHPDTYTVASSSETVSSVACKYGDVYPSAIAQQSGISVSATLSVGQQLKIP